MLNKMKGILNQLGHMWQEISVLQRHAHIHVPSILQANPTPEYDLEVYPYYRGHWTTVIVLQYNIVSHH